MTPTAFWVVALAHASVARAEMATCFSAVPHGGGLRFHLPGPEELGGPKGSQTTGALNSAGLGPRQLDTYGQPLGTCKLTFPHTGVVT